MGRFVPPRSSDPFGEGFDWAESKMRAFEARKGLRDIEKTKEGRAYTSEQDQYAENVANAGLRGVDGSIDPNATPYYITKYDEIGNRSFIPNPQHPAWTTEARVSSDPNDTRTGGSVPARTAYDYAPSKQEKAYVYGDPSAGGLSGQTPFTSDQKRKWKAEQRAAVYRKAGLEEQAQAEEDRIESMEDRSLRRQATTAEIERGKKQDERLSREDQEAAEFKVLATALAGGKPGIFKWYKTQVPDGWDVKQIKNPDGTFSAVQTKNEGGKEVVGDVLTTYKNDLDLQMQVAQLSPKLVGSVLALRQKEADSERDAAIRGAAGGGKGESLQKVQWTDSTGKKQTGIIGMEKVGKKWVPYDPATGQPLAASDPRSKAAFATELGEPSGPDLFQQRIARVMANKDLTDAEVMAQIGSIERERDLTKKAAVGDGAMAGFGKKDESGASVPSKRGIYLKELQKLEDLRGGMFMPTPSRNTDAIARQEEVVRKALQNLY